MSGKTVYIVVGWLHDMCDDDGIPEACVFRDADKAEIYEDFLYKTGASCVHIYKREMDEALPFGYEAIPKIDTQDTICRINEVIRNYEIQRTQEADL